MLYSLHISLLQAEILSGQPYIHITAKCSYHFGRDVCYFSTITFDFKFIPAIFKMYPELQQSV
jgi:hypothetical protein